MIMFDPKNANAFNPKWNQNQIRSNPNSATAKQAQAQLDAYKAWKGKSTQPAGAAPQTTTPSSASTSQPQGFFSAGNQFGQAANDAWQKQSDWINQNQPNFDNVAKLPGAEDFSAERNRIETDMFNHQKQDLDTRYKQESDDFEQKMANQGVDIGSPRYQREKELFERGRNQAYTDARFGAMQNAGAEQSRLFGDAMSAHQQGTRDVSDLRTLRTNDLAALLNPAFSAQQGINQQNEANTNRAFTRSENDRTRQFQKSENAKTRSAQARASGGGGNSLDMNSLLELIKSLTGEDLKG